MFSIVAPAALSATTASVPGSAGYYYATGLDSGNSAHTPGASESAQFYVQPEKVLNNGDHSLTEIWVNDAAGNAAEIGVMIDPAFWGTPNPVLFVDSWSKGKFNGYDNDGFISSSAVKPGGQLKAGWTEFGFSYAGGSLSVSVNGTNIGSFPSSFWPGGWDATTGVMTYGEAYNVKNGDDLPAMDGGIRNFSAGGNHITYTGSGVSAPYAIHSKSATGFTFSGEG
jgi:Neprosin